VGYRRQSGRQTDLQTWRREATSLAAYASLIRYADPELIRINVQRAVNSGFRHLKLHEVDVEVIRAACEAAGPAWKSPSTSTPLDGARSARHDRETSPVESALDRRAGVAAGKLFGLATVRQQGGIPVAAGENASTLMDFQHLLEAGAVDFVQPSPAKMGGITELQKVYALANAHGVTVMVHAFYDGPACWPPCMAVRPWAVRNPWSNGVTSISKRSCMATPSFRVTAASTYHKGRGSASSQTRTSSATTASNPDHPSRPVFAG
jgi:hypothetical protein